MKSLHEGLTSSKALRSCGSSREAYKDEEALENPSQQFQWTDIRSTVEFKHKKTRTGLSNLPATYAAKAYDVPEAKKYINYWRETNHTIEPTGLTPLPTSGAATSSHQTTDAHKLSRQFA
jgi:hypothetical protein